MLKNIPMRCSGEAQRLCDWLAGGLSAVIHFFRFPPSDRRARQWAMSSRVGCRASDELVLNGDCSAKNPKAEIWTRPHWPVRMQQKWWPTTRSPQVHNCFHQCLISGCLEAISAFLSFFFLHTSMESHSSMHSTFNSAWTSYSLSTSSSSSQSHYKWIWSLVLAFWQDELTPGQESAWLEHFYTLMDAAH